MLLNSLLIEHAKRQPAKAAVITDERGITYGELSQAVESMANSLLDRGLQRGDRVAVHSSNSVEMVVLLMGILRAGLIAVPINTRMKLPEIAYVLEHSGAKVCFSEPALAAMIEGAEIIGTLPHSKGSRGQIPLPGADDPAMLLYTSGTTARPKGVIHTQRTFFEGANSIVRTASFVPDDRVLGTTPLAHASGLFCVLFIGLILGSTSVLPRTFNPVAVLDLIERFECTYMFTLPAMLQLIVGEQVSRPRNISTLRAIGAGGDTVPLALQRRISDLFGLEVREGLGLTEVVPAAFNRPGAVRTGSLGTVPEGFSLRIIDSSGNDVATGEVGELILRSPANCIGYWNDPEATAKLLEGGWLHTGDLASCDEDGYYWFKGRLKQIIIRGGSNISPQEVEEALYQHPAVLEAGVVGLHDPVFGELPVAFVSLREGRSVSEDDLLAQVRTVLADYKTPEHIYFVDELPKGLTGKVDRRRLREILLADADFIETQAVLRV